MAGDIRTDAVLLNPLLRIRAACGQLAASAVDFRNSKLDQLTGDTLSAVLIIDNGLADLIAIVRDFRKCHFGDFFTAVIDTADF